MSGLAPSNQFQNTTNAPENFRDDPPKVERSNYFDAGVSHQFTKEWQVSLDGFYKQAHNLIDLGQFGAPVILAPYNYRTGTVYGGGTQHDLHHGRAFALRKFLLGPRHGPRSGLPAVPLDQR